MLRFQHGFRFEFYGLEASGVARAWVASNPDLHSLIISRSIPLFF
jgi:hypothetical protein